MLTNVRYILLTALRDWLFAALIAGVVICFLIAHMLGGTAIIETQEMTLSYTAASARIVIMTGLIVFVCFHVRSAFDTREIDVFLSRPITRPSLVFSYWLGFATVALLLVVPTIALLGMQGLLSKQGFALWSASLLLECWLVIAVALFAAFTLKSAVTSVMASMGFYVLGRMMGFFDALIHTPGLRLLSGVMPRLDLFSKSAWLIYSVKNVPELKAYAIEALLFGLLLMFFTIIGFRRKQF